MSMPISTAFGGALERHPDGWRWRDGADEPRVRDMLLADIAPNFRCSGGCVEVPHDWRRPRHWPHGRVDDAAAQAIDVALREGSQPRGIFAEGLAEQLDDHRLTTHGMVVPIALWDAILREPCGVWWNKADEPAILARAAALGEKKEA